MEETDVTHIHDEIDRHCEAITNAGFDRVIGTSGTILSIGVVAATAARGAPPAEVRNLRVPSKQIRGVRKQMVALALRERLEVSGLDPQRADLVVAGSVLIDTILTRITLAGAVYLAIVAIIPNFLISGFRVAPIPFIGERLDAALPRFITQGLNVPFFFGGTSFLIVVGVAMDTVQQVESQLIMRHYDGFMKKTRIRGRRG
jgi:preprotein translocase subunit SecY